MVRSFALQILRQELLHCIPRKTRHVPWLLRCTPCFRNGSEAAAALSSWEVRFDPESCRGDRTSARQLRAKSAHPRVARNTPILRVTARFLSGRPTRRFVPYYRVSINRQGRSGLGLKAQQKAVRDFQAVLSEPELLRALFDVGYFLSDMPPSV